MGELLFKKNIDQFVLKDGFTIPVSAVEKLQNALGVKLAKGNSAKIKILIEGKELDSNFNNDLEV